MMPRAVLTPALLTRALLVFAVALTGCFEDNEAEQTPDMMVQPTPDMGLPPGVICEAGQTECDAEGRLRTCLAEEDGWLVEPCADPAVCQEGACVTLVCAAGARICEGDAVRVCDASGQFYAEPTPCAEGETCFDGVCLPRSCEPGEQACGEGVLLTCADDGLSYERTPCGEGEICVDGGCATPPPTCAPGTTLCGATSVFECAEDGAGFIETPCPPGQVCFESECISCVRDSDCGARDRVCARGQCVEPPLTVATVELPPAQEGIEYEVFLEAAFGQPPYTWGLSEGNLPRGVGLNGEGELRGAPQQVGRFPLTVRVTDDARNVAQAELELVVFAAGLAITTEELPEGEDGFNYEAQLEAVGGEAPFAWIVVDGALPAGVQLTGDGRLVGTPSEVGPFPFRARVVDAGDPPQAAERDLVLPVSVAPLEITADQSFDLFFTRVITLPTLTIIGGNPLPYDTRLTAQGGLRPYTWSETELPANLRPFLADSGIPDGLTLDEDGRLSGVIEDLDQVIELQIPFTEIVLTGFFFTAEVVDSQEVADRDNAIFLLPTLPLGM